MRDLDVLELCGLRDKAQRPAGSLGLLDLKRLEMARALSLHPRVLFLDEVGAGLVSHETEQMIDIVRKVHAEGVALIVVEHVEAVIRELAQRVIVIDWGKVVARGTPEEVAADPTVRSIYLGEGSTPECAARHGHTAGDGRAAAARTGRRHRRVRQGGGPRRRQPAGAAGRGRLRAGRQRRGKDDDDPRHHRPAARVLG